MKCLPLVQHTVLDSGAKPLEPFQGRLECSEGGSTGRRVKKTLPLSSKTAVRSAPSRDQRSARVIGGKCGKKQGERSRRAGVRAVVLLQPVGQFDCQIDAFADL